MARSGSALGVCWPGYRLSFDASALLPRRCRLIHATAIVPRVETVVPIRVTHSSGVICSSCSSPSLDDLGDDGKGLRRACLTVLCTNLGRAWGQVGGHAVLQRCSHGDGLWTTTVIWTLSLITGLRSDVDKIVGVSHKIPSPACPRPCSR